MNPSVWGPILTSISVNIGQQKMSYYPCFKQCQLLMSCTVIHTRHLRLFEEHVWCFLLQNGIINTYISHRRCCLVGQGRYTDAPMALLLLHLPYRFPADSEGHQRNSLRSFALYVCQTHCQVAPNSEVASRQYKSQ